MTFLIRRKQNCKELFDDEVHTSGTTRGLRVMKYKKSRNPRPTEGSEVKELVLMKKGHFYENVIGEVFPRCLAFSKYHYRLQGLPVTFTHIHKKHTATQTHTYTAI